MFISRRSSLCWDSALLSALRPPQQYSLHQLPGDWGRALLPGVGRRRREDRFKWGLCSGRFLAIWLFPLLDPEFRLPRRGLSGGDQPRGLMDALASEFDDTAAGPETLFYYWVTACNGAGCSGLSAHDTGYRRALPVVPPSSRRVLPAILGILLD